MQCSGSRRTWGVQTEDRPEVNALNACKEGSFQRLCSLPPAGQTSVTGTRTPHSVCREAARPVL